MWSSRDRRRTIQSILRVAVELRPSREAHLYVLRTRLHQTMPSRWLEGWDLAESTDCFGLVYRDGPGQACKTKWRVDLWGALLHVDERS